jgi:hypothetical protein
LGFVESHLRVAFLLAVWAIHACAVENSCDCAYVINTQVAVSMRIPKHFCPKTRMNAA